MSAVRRLRRGRHAITIPHKPIQIHILQDRAEASTPLRIALIRAVLFAGRSTHRTHVVRVLNVEHRLALLDERREGRALGVFHALLVDAELGEVGDPLHYAARVFQAHCEAVGDGVS